MNKYIFIVITLILSGKLFAAESSHHGEASQQGDQRRIELDNGKKWPTDMHLRRGMEKINNLTQKNKSNIENMTMPQDEFVKLGNDIKEQVHFILKNCKLSAKVDQELHKIIVPILNSAEIFKEQRTQQEKQKAFLVVLKSLEQYGTYFEHPDWSTSK